MNKTKTKRKSFCALVIVLAIVCLTGCTAQTPSASITNSGSFDVTPEATVSSSEPVLDGMERVLVDDIFSYYRDVTTDVMYVRYQGVYAGGLTVMLDPNTNGPLTYTNWLKYQPE